MLGLLIQSHPWSHTIARTSSPQPRLMPNSLTADYAINEFLQRKGGVTSMSPNSWNPTEPVPKRIKEILKELGAAVAVIPERALGDLGLAEDTVRARINSEFFPVPYPGLSDAQVTSSTTVLALVIAVNDKLDKQGRSWP